MNNNQNVDKICLIKTPLGVFPILIFWIVTIIYFALGYNISLEKGFSFKLLIFMSFFESIIYLVTVMGLRSYTIYNDSIEIYAPYNIFNRRKTIVICDIIKIVYYTNVRGSNTFKFFFKNGSRMTTYYNRYLFHDDKFDEVINYFKSKEIPLFRRKIFNKIVPFDEQ
jgi:hypothetical protein